MMPAIRSAGDLSPFTPVLSAARSFVIFPEKRASFSAIINPPQVTILAVGAARRQPFETADGGVAFASVLTATLSCDHRVVDGTLGAELLAAVKALIETPVTMLV